MTISYLKKGQSFLELKSDVVSGQNVETLHPPRLSLSLSGDCPAVAPESGQTTRRGTITSHTEYTPKLNSPISVIMEPMDLDTPPQRSNFVIPSIVISPLSDSNGTETTFKYKHGKFHFSERDIDYGFVFNTTIIKLTIK